ncbi:MAG: hypothetical protein WBB74_04945 [Gaiellaceae bacterium]
MRARTKFNGWSSLAISACSAALLAAGCSSSGPKAVTIPAARTFKLVGFSPVRAMPNRPTAISFTIQQPSGKPLTDYRRGAGPHTGVHLIIVKSDLSAIIHQHPPVGPNGRLDQPVTFPSPGRYRVIVDAYPNLTGVYRNFQLFSSIRVAGATRAQPLPQYHPSVDVGGYRFTIQGKPRLKAIEAALMTVRVTDPNGRPAQFTPWFGALAHAIFFRRGSLDYFHTHVCSPGATGCSSILGGTSVTGNSVRPGKLTVGVLVPLAGTWRLFLQCKVNGHILTAPFTLAVS